MSTKRYYTIHKGDDECDPRDSKFVFFKKPSSYKFSFRFGHNCLYHLGNSKYDMDLNKLAGISRNLSVSQCGTRIGWNCGSKTMEELNADPWFVLRAYVEESNKRVPTSDSPRDRLGLVRPKVWYDGDIVFRSMTGEEMALFRTLSAKTGDVIVAGSETSVYDLGYRHVSETRVSVSGGLDPDTGLLLNPDYQDMIKPENIKKYIKSSQVAVMPIKPPSSMGYYYYFPWFGGDYPLGCPNDMDIDIIHQY